MNKERDAIESVSATNTMDAHADAVRKLEEDSKICGYVQVSVGRWHDDPNGSEFVNGRQGYYTHDDSLDQIVPVTNLLTTDGRDEFHALCYINVATPNDGSNHLAVSADVGAPAAGDTALTGEIVAGGLARSDPSDTISHVDNTNVSTIAHTFTASSAHTAVHKAALFNLNAAGIMSHAAVFTSDVTLAINDTLTVTWTNTLG